MKKAGSYLCAGAMLCLILDAGTGANAVREGAQMVLRSALPSLFPFFVLSAWMVPRLSSLRIGWLSRLLSIPEGWESIFVLGCVGGYPVGAQAIAQGFENKALDRASAIRMLGFCTNCGPAFLFGLVGSNFPQRSTPFIIYLICILSAMLTGVFWPQQHTVTRQAEATAPASLSSAVQKAIRSMASVSAWILLGKVVLAYLEKWFLWMLPQDICILVSGMLELTNGCLSLFRIESESLRFIAACLMCVFGGGCVIMQVNTLCSAAGLDASSYFKQKCAQTALALGLSILYLILPGGAVGKAAQITVLAGVLMTIQKKTVEIPSAMVYNGVS